MSYKIISIPTKRGGADISLCPSGWEHDSIVHWPQKLLNVLQTDPHIIPEEDWRKYKCTVKKRNIQNYDEAVRWERMYESLDTDAEQNVDTEKYLPALPAARKPTTKKQKNQNAQSNNINGLFASACDAPWDIEVNDLPHQKSSTPEPILSSQFGLPNQQSIPDRDFDISSTPVMVENLAGNLTSLIMPSLWDNDLFKDLKSDLQQFKEQTEEELKIIQERQISNDARVLTALDKVLSTLDEIKNLVVNTQNSVEVSRIAHQVHYSRAESSDLLTKYPIPLLELDELKKFDAELNDKYFNEIWVNHFGNIFGNDGKNKKGELVGKKLCETILSKSLMTEISYTGVSRTAGVESKYALQKLESLLSLITQVTKNADDRWDSAATVELLSSKLLKHSKKRQIAHELKIQNLGKKQMKSTATDKKNNKVEDANEINDIAANEANATLTFPENNEAVGSNETEIIINLNEEFTEAEETANYDEQ